MRWPVVCLPHAKKFCFLVAVVSCLLLHVGGGGILMPHLNGIFINPSACLGSGCAIYHQVTIGAGENNGMFGSPRLGDNVVVYAGAKIIGPYFCWK